MNCYDNCTFHSFQQISFNKSTFLFAFFRSFLRSFDRLFLQSFVCLFIRLVGQSVISRSVICLFVCLVISNNQFFCSFSRSSYLSSVPLFIHSFVYFKFSLQPALKQILNGKRTSERHTIYTCGRVSEKNGLKLRAGFGPVGEENLVRQSQMFGVFILTKMTVQHSHSLKKYPPTQKGTFRKLTLNLCTPCFLLFSIVPGNKLQKLGNTVQRIKRFVEFDSGLHIKDGLRFYCFSLLFCFLLTARGNNGLAFGLL